MATTKPPRRLRIKPHCFIDGVREGRRLRPGLYLTGENLSEQEASVLASDKFKHCVDILTDTPPAEELAKDTDTPQPTDAYKYTKRKELEAAQRKIQEVSPHKVTVGEHK